MLGVCSSADERPDELADQPPPRAGRVRSGNGAERNRSPLRVRRLTGPRLNRVRGKVRLRSIRTLGWHVSLLREAAMRRDGISRPDRAVLVESYPALFVDEQWSKRGHGSIRASGGNGIGRSASTSPSQMSDGAPTALDRRKRKKAGQSTTTVANIISRLCQSGLRRIATPKTTKAVKIERLVRVPIIVVRAVGTVDRSRSVAHRAVPCR